MEKILQTERLLLRPLNISELRNIYDGGLDVSEISIDPEAVSEVVISAIKKKIAKMKNMAEELVELYTYWLIVDRQSDKGIGFIGFKGLDKDGYIEVGYSISPNYRKKRIMTEALAAMSKRFSKYENVNGIAASVKKTNTGSIKVLRNCGFAEAGTSEQELFYRFGFRQK